MKVQDFYGKAIRDYRKYNNLSIYKCAARMNTSWFELWLKEKGCIKTTMEDVSKACDAIPASFKDIDARAEYYYILKSGK